MYSFCQPSIRYVLMLQYSARNQVACQVLGISIYAISLVKIYFFQFDVFTFLLFSLFRPFSLSFNPFTFFIVFFFIAPEFFPKFLNLFYRRSFCGWMGYFPISQQNFFASILDTLLYLKNFVLFSNLLILCALTCFLSFIISFVVFIFFSFCNLYFL